MKKLKANTVLSAFIFGVSILLLCSFGTDTAYIILSRYKLQKIADAAALEYAATRGRDIKYSEDSKTNCDIKVRQKFQHIYNTLGAGTLAFDIVTMKEKNNDAKKETLVKVQAQSRIMPAFLRFTGAREIILHANAYAKTSMIEVTKEMSMVSLGDPDVSETTYTVFKPPYTDMASRIKTNMITSKAGFNGDFAIDFAYQMPGDADFTTGGGFFIFAGQKTGDEIQWVDIGNKVKKINPADPAPYEKIYFKKVIDPSTPYFYCVNGVQNDGITAKTITFELSAPDAAGALGHINRFDYLKIYKAGTIAGTSINGITVNRPCNPDFITALPGAEAAAAAGRAYTPASVAYSTPASRSGDIDSSTTTVEVSAEPNIFNTPSRVRLIIMNNVTLINALEYNSLIGIDEKICGAH